MPRLAAAVCGRGLSHFSHESFRLDAVSRLLGSGACRVVELWCIEVIALPPNEGMELQVEVSPALQEEAGASSSLQLISDVMRHSGALRIDCETPSLC